MDSDPAPPRRPRQSTANARLVIAAMIVVAVTALVPFLIIDAEWAWARDAWAREFLFFSQGRWFFYGLPTLTMALLGLSLVVKSRQR